MKATILLLLLALFGGALWTAQAQTDEEWMAAAVKQYPELIVQNSKLNQLWCAGYNRMQALSQGSFSNPKWPMILAQQCDAQLRAAEASGAPLPIQNVLELPPNLRETVQLPYPSREPVARRAPQPVTGPQNKDVAFSLRPEYERLGVEVRNQKARGTCSIFGFIGCLDYYSAKAGGCTQLSEQFAGWAHSRITGSLTGTSHGYYVKDLVDGIKKFGICSDVLMPYKVDSVGNPSKAALQDASARRKITFTWIHEDATNATGFNDAEIEAMCKAISLGQPVSSAVVIPFSSWSNFKEPFTIDNKGFPIASVAHQVVFVGYEKGANLEGGGRMEFRNSWGKDWGDRGYAWYSFGYLKKRGEQAYTLVGEF